MTSQANGSNHNDEIECRLCTADLSLVSSRIEAVVELYFLVISSGYAFIRPCYIHNTLECLVWRLELRETAMVQISLVYFAELNS